MENKEKHPKMPLSQRAKQFLPFVAQPGLYEALEAEAKRHEVIYQKADTHIKPDAEDAADI